jgi:hypothetical protein
MEVETPFVDPEKLKIRLYFSLSEKDPRLPPGIVENLTELASAGRQPHESSEIFSKRLTGLRPTLARNSVGTAPFRLGLRRICRGWSRFRLCGADNNG